MLRNKFMRGTTLRELREKHVVETSTQAQLITVTSIMTVLGMLIFGFAMYLMTCERTPFIGFGCALLGPMVMMSNIVGSYGAWRVKRVCESSISPVAPLGTSVDLRDIASGRG